MQEAYIGKTARLYFNKCLCLLFLKKSLYLYINSHNFYFIYPSGFKALPSFCAA